MKRKRYFCSNNLIINFAKHHLFMYKTNLYPGNEMTRLSFSQQLHKLATCLCSYFMTILMTASMMTLASCNDRNEPEPPVNPVNPPETPVAKIDTVSFTVKPILTDIAREIDNTYKALADTLKYVKSFTVDGNICIAEVDFELMQKLGALKTQLGNRFSSGYIFPKEVILLLFSEYSKWGGLTLGGDEMLFLVL